MPRNTPAAAAASTSASNHKELQNDPKTQNKLTPLFAGTNRALLFKPSQILRGIYTGISVAALTYERNFEKDIENSFKAAMQEEKRLTANNKKPAPEDWFKLAKLYGSIAYKIITEKKIPMRYLGDMLANGDPNKDEDTFYTKPISKYCTDAKRCLGKIASPQMIAESTCYLIQINFILYICKRNILFMCMRDDKLNTELMANYSSLENLVKREFNKDLERIFMLADVCYQAGKICVEINRSEFFDEAKSSLNTAFNLINIISKTHPSADIDFLLSKVLRYLAAIQLKEKIDPITKGINFYSEALKLAEKTYEGPRELYQDDPGHLASDDYIQECIRDYSDSETKTCDNYSEKITRFANIPLKYLTDATKGYLLAAHTDAATWELRYNSIATDPTRLDLKKLVADHAKSIADARARLLLDDGISVAHVESPLTDANAKRKASNNKSEANKKRRVETATAVDAKQTAAKPTFSWPKITDAFTANKPLQVQQRHPIPTTSSTPQCKQ